MRHIIKRNEPDELRNYKETPGVCFDDMDRLTKDALKNALLEEQGYICCYCGKRIFLDCNTILEHLLPRSNPNYQHLELDYNNILASCDGGQGVRRSGNRQFPEYCDSKKHNNVIPISPLDPNCESCFYFDEEGKIYPKKPDANATIRILGLDNSYLNHCRKAALEFYKELPDDTNWDDELNLLHSLNTIGQYGEFCFVIESYIKLFRKVS